MAFTQICLGARYFMQDNVMDMCLSAVRPAEWTLGQLSSSVVAVVLFMQGRVPNELLDSQVDPASFEISGHIIMKRQQDYDGLTQDAIWDLLSYASLSEDAFIKFSHFALDY